MSRVAVMLAAAAMLAGCQSEAERAVAMSMRDPDSAKFRDIERCDNDPEVITGNVNGTNGFGAYAGYVRFFYVDGRAVFADSERFTDLIARCYGPVATPTL